MSADDYSTEASTFHIRPWRWATLGWIVALLVIAAAAPLAICMPPGGDVTVRDMNVRSMLRGGTHYRDVFDANLPGMDWLTAGVRFVIGWRSEAIQAVDLAVVAIALLLLLNWVYQCDGSVSAIAWMTAAAALFYPFTSEINRVQPDTWALVPALGAMWIRFGRIERAGEARSTADTVFEGVLWGAAFWIKPHTIAPALAVWLVSARLISRREVWLGVFQDLFWLVVGIVAAAAGGFAWIYFTGAWPHFLDTARNWYPAMQAGVWPVTYSRLETTVTSFQPWGLLHLLAVPMAVLAFWEARLWSRRSGFPARIWCSSWWYQPAEVEPAANARVYLAALYLGWFAQAICLQQGTEPVQVPLIFLAMAVVASHRWAFGFVYLTWFALLGAVLNVPTAAEFARKVDPHFRAVRLERHPLTDPRIAQVIPRCYREGSTPEIRDRIGKTVDTRAGTNWTSLEAVADHLRSLDPPIGPGELNCWHDGTHPLYRMLDVDPATRYMQYGKMFAIRSPDDWIRKRVAGAVAESGQKYVVSDLRYLDPARSLEVEPGDDPLKLPDWFPASERESFPWNQPIVFRSGRYLVHRIEKPLGTIDIAGRPADAGQPSR